MTKNKSSLEMLEKGLRAEIQQVSLEHSRRNPLLLFALGVLAGPFMATGSLFVPLIGFLSSGLLLFQTIAYCAIKRSILLAASWLAGALVSNLSLTLLFAAFFSRMTIIFYVLVAFSMAILIALNVLMAVLIWSHYERGAFILEQRKMRQQNRKQGHPLKVLCITTMFPNKSLPQFGIFVLRRLKAAQNHADITIINPIPYFPGAALLERYKYRKGIPYRETIWGTEVLHPRYFSIPGLLKPLDGFFLYLALKSYIKPEFDIIDAQLAYPDGFAAQLLADWMLVPSVVTLRGHDINVLPNMPIRGRMVRWVLRRASRVMAVAESLRSEAAKLVPLDDRSQTIPNGVDTTIFQPIPKEEAKEKLGLKHDTRYILSVGHLIERKGHHLLVEALAQAHQTTGAQIELLIVGAASLEGDYSSFLQTKITQLGMENFVHLVGEKSQEELGLWYSASEMLCLASSMEGWANVLLESLACARPVLATRVWGTPEVITENQGILVERSASALAKGLCQMLSMKWDAAALRKYAQRFSWEKAGEDLVANYKLAVNTWPVDTISVDTVALNTEHQS
jgi:teichuronic acid biosynthesis glycosyltransferase TuaC